MPKIRERRAIRIVSLRVLSEGMGHVLNEDSAVANVEAQGGKLAIYIYI